MRISCIQLIACYLLATLEMLSQNRLSCNLFIPEITGLSVRILEVECKVLLTEFEQKSDITQGGMIKCFYTLSLTHDELVGRGKYRLFS